MQYTTSNSNKQLNNINNSNNLSKSKSNIINVNNPNNPNILNYDYATEHGLRELYYLTRNPFSIKMVYDYTDFKAFPFLMLEIHRLLRSRLITESLNLPFERTYTLIVGDRGIGKTTTLMFLKDVIETMKKPNMKCKYFPSTKGVSNLQLLTRSIVGNTYFEKKFSDSITTLNNFLSGTRYYLIIDVPDSTTNAELRALSYALEEIKAVKNISIIMAMNPQHVSKMENITLILGKFTSFFLDPFDYEHTRELIVDRLKTARLKTYNGNELYPFTEDAVQKIFEISKGNPRNILTCADVSLNFAREKRIRKIDSNIIFESVSKYYVKKIIEERTHIPSERKLLMVLYNEIKNTFKGEAKGLMALLNHMKKKYGWSESRTRRKLSILQKYGLIEVDRDFKDGWTNVIRTIP